MVAGRGLVIGPAQDRGSAIGLRNCQDMVRSVAVDSAMVKSAGDDWVTDKLEVDD
jgi:hypothetical protein